MRGGDIVYEYEKENMDGDSLETKAASARIELNNPGHQNCFTT